MVKRRSVRERGSSGADRPGKGFLGEGVEFGGREQVDPHVFQAFAALLEEGDSKKATPPSNRAARFVQDHGAGFTDQMWRAASR